MTYIDYLNTFNRWLESHTLPTGAQLLYFRLLNVFNAAGWPEDVRLDTLRLMCLVGSTSNKTAWRARDELVEAGLITIQKGRKGTPTLYRLTGDKMGDRTGDKIGGKNDSGKLCGVDFGTYDGTNSGTYDGTNSGTYNGTLNKTKSKTETKTPVEPNNCNYCPPNPPEGGRSAAVAAYLSKINPSASPVSIDELKGYVDQMGDDVCIRAMDIALDAKKATWPYIRGVLRKWQGMGVTCLADIAEKEAEHGHHGADPGGDTGKYSALDRTIL